MALDGFEPAGSFVVADLFTAEAQQAVVGR